MLRTDRNPQGGETIKIAAVKKQLQSGLGPERRSERQVNLSHVKEKDPLPSRRLVAKAEGEHYYVPFLLTMLGLICGLGQEWRWRDSIKTTTLITLVIMIAGVYA
ncbi:hypothetical protein [Marinobacterium aestuariivivens]|uniref:Uncharacterized protein n=1 Tax=Marinobacterium aestuariivivens TaxID=1698799 RepID=A0ABW2A966_9GAMM